jgi:RNA recognition motif-containing protein
MTIYVGSIPFKWSENDIRKIFEIYGTVTEVKLAINYKTRQSNGFAFVEMENDAEAKDAISKLNGQEEEGRKIIVTVSIPKSQQPPKSPQQRKPFKKPGSSSIPKKKLPPWLRREP